MPADPDDVAKALDLAQDAGSRGGARTRLERAREGRRFPGRRDPYREGLDRFEMKGATAIVGAGLPTPLLARRTAEAGFAGVERFIGIPGTVGGGVYMNAGAHGPSSRKCSPKPPSWIQGEDPAGPAQADLVQVPLLKPRQRDRARAKLALIEEPPAKLKELQARLLRWRKAGTPFDQPCAGSVFKNPGGARTAGALIDECGLKALHRRRAGVLVACELHCQHRHRDGE